MTEFCFAVRAAYRQAQAEWYYRLQVWLAQSGQRRRKDERRAGEIRQEVVEGALACHRDAHRVWTRR